MDDFSDDDMFTRSVRRTLNRYFNEPLKRNCFSVANVNVDSVEVFARQQKALLKRVDVLITETRRKLTFVLLRCLGPGKPLERQRATAVARVLTQRNAAAHVREWNAIASTFYVYNRYVTRCTAHKMLERVEFEKTVAWAREMRRDFAPVLKSGNLDVADLLLCLCHGALEMSFASTKLSVDGKLPVDDCMNESDNNNNNNKNDDDDDDEDALRRLVPIRFVRHLAYFASSLPSADDRRLLRPSHLHTLWNLYVFRRFQRRGASLQDNPMRKYMSAFTNIFGIYEPMRNALLRLAEHTLHVADALRVDPGLPISNVLQMTWRIRTINLIQALDGLHFTHSMIRQHRIQSVLVSTALRATDSESLASADDSDNTK